MFELRECTAASIQAAMAAGELTSEELVLAYFDRIAAADRSGPTLNSVLELNPDAVTTAAAMDRLRAQGRVLSPLHGVPVLLKDNINTHDKLHTSAGSLALADNYAPYDSAVAARLRAAGAVILGKANMTELANFMAYHMKGGYSSRGGQVKNPYNPAAEVYGSSSGSAVAVSANLTALAVGTETNGSIIAPAFINGCVGLKPTVGLVSRTGIVPISATQDTAGPLTRTVADAAALLNVLAGEDESDPATLGVDALRPKDYTSFLDADGLRNMRLGVSWYNARPAENRGRYLTEEMTALAQRAVDDMREAGAVIVDGCDVPTDMNNFDVMLYEFRQCLDAYLATTNCRVRTLEQMIDFYMAHPKEGLKYGMGILLDAQLKAARGLTDPAYIEAKRKCLEVSRGGLDKAFAEHELDLLVLPLFSGLSPVSGYPSICVPAGYTPDGTPYGITLVGRPFDEPKLIRAAYAYEQFSKRRVAPEV